MGVTAAAKMVKVVDDEQGAANGERHSAAAAASAGLKLGIVRLGRAGGKVRRATHVTHVDSSAVGERAQFPATYSTTITLFICTAA